MRVTLHNENQRYVASLFEREIEKSRFTADIEYLGPHSLKFKNIRLKEKKEYCGNHPNACEITIGRQRRNPRFNFLEGADWVSWNDFINDICDENEIDANIYTSVCWVRKGFKRRWNYRSHMVGHFWQWNKDEPDCFYADMVGKKAGNSMYPYGTPGEYTRELEVIRENVRVA